MNHFTSFQNRLFDIIASSSSSSLRPQLRTSICRCEYNLFTIYIVFTYRHDIKYSPHRIFQKWVDFNLLIEIDVLLWKILCLVIVRKQVNKTLLFSPSYSKPNTTTRRGTHMMWPITPIMYIVLEVKPKNWPKRLLWYALYSTRFCNHVQIIDFQIFYCFEWFAIRYSVKLTKHTQKVLHIWKCMKGKSWWILFNLSSKCVCSYCMEQQKRFKNIWKYKFRCGVQHIHTFIVIIRSHYAIDSNNLYAGTF